MQDSPFSGDPEPAVQSAARTIVVLKLPAAAQALIRDGDLIGGLNPTLFGAGEQAEMEEVQKFASELIDPQSKLLLVGLQHALEEEHAAAVHFIELKSGYDLEGVGLEIKDDTVTEEMLHGPLRVTFVSWTSK